MYCESKVLSLTAEQRIRCLNSSVFIDVIILSYFTVYRFSVPYLTI